MYYLVEVKQRYMTCPVRFETLESAKNWKVLQLKQGAFRVNIYEMQDNNPSGKLIEE